MLFSQGVKTRDLWEEIFGRFGKENSSMTEKNSMLETDLVSSLITEA